MTDTALSLAFQVALDREAERERQEEERLRQVNRGPSLTMIRWAKERSRIAELYRQQKTVSEISLSIKRSRRYVYRHLTTALWSTS